jgi:hypothetical protein
MCDNVLVQLPSPSVVIVAASVTANVRPCGNDSHRTNAFVALLRNAIIVHAKQPLT